MKSLIGAILILSSFVTAAGQDLYVKALRSSTYITTPNKLTVKSQLGNYSNTNQLNFTVRIGIDNTRLTCGHTSVAKFATTETTADTITIYLNEVVKIRKPDIVERPDGTTVELPQPCSLGTGAKLISIPVSKMFIRTNIESKKIVIVTEKRLYHYTLTQTQSGEVTLTSNSPF